MSAVTFKPKVYLKDGCPFSFKLLLFLTGAGILDQVKVIRCNPEAPGFEEIKSKLQAGLHEPATFPTVEIEPDRYLSDSDALIQHFASKHKVDPGRLPTLSFYVQTIFPQLRQLHQDRAT